MLKVIPEWDDEISSNNVCLLWHAGSQSKDDPINNILRKFIKYLPKRIVP